MGFALSKGRLRIRSNIEPLLCILGDLSAKDTWYFITRKAKLRRNQGSAESRVALKHLPFGMKRPYRWRWVKSVANRMTPNVAVEV